MLIPPTKRMLKKRNVKKEKVIGNRRKFQEQIEFEMTQSKSHVEFKKEEKLSIEKEEFRAEKDAAENLVEEYRKKVFALKARRKRDCKTSKKESWENWKVNKFRQSSKKLDTSLLKSNFALFDDTDISIIKSVSNFYILNDQ